MDWTNETVLKFLELYQTHPCIWDPKSPWHKNKNQVDDAWVDIQNNLGQAYTVKDLKRKRESLMSAYRGYRTKIMKSQTGSGAEVYQPTWFAYKLMDSFLGDIYKCSPTIVAEENHTQQDDEYQKDTDTSNCSGDENKNETDTKIQRPVICKRRIQNKKRLNHSMNILKTVSHKHEHEKDECYHFGKLIEKKMRRFSEEKRDLMMIKINQLIYDECYEKNLPEPKL